MSIFNKKVDDRRVTEIHSLLPPIAYVYETPVEDASADLIYNTRQSISEVLNERDDRLVVVIGPCSIHDPKAAIEYAEKLKQQADKYKDDLIVVMRVYFEKPRTTVGWRGLINDPHLDGSFDINRGLKIARQLLSRINQIGLPAASEFLDVFSPQYIADLISWGAIGARTTESQIHRELASGLSCPVGFKNGTDGNVKIAVDALIVASNSHHFLSVAKSGYSTIIRTSGNSDVHLILRGGSKGPNYSKAHVEEAVSLLKAADRRCNLMIDFSHANSQKDFKRQMDVCKDVCNQISEGSYFISGVMVESNLVEGRQNLDSKASLNYGQSITDGCIGWNDSEKLLEQLALAVSKRRNIGRK